MLRRCLQLQVYVRVCARISDWHRVGLQSFSCTTFRLCKEDRAGGCSAYTRREVVSSMEVVTVDADTLHGDVPGVKGSYCIAYSSGVRSCSWLFRLPTMLIGTAGEDVAGSPYFANQSPALMT